MDNKPVDNLITRMKTARINDGLNVVRQGPLSDQGAKLNGTGFAPGRRVYDSVTGQVVEVVGATIATVPAAALEGV